MTALDLTCYYCGAEESCTTRLLSHLNFLSKQDVGFHQANALEKAGDVLLAPKIMLWKGCNYKNVLNIAAIAFAVFTEFLQYPSATTHTWVVGTLVMFQFGAISCRVFGRLFNPVLMDNFYESVHWSGTELVFIENCELDIELD